MKLLRKLKNFFFPPVSSDEKLLNENNFHVRFTVGVIEFADNVESDGGRNFCKSSLPVPSA